MAFTVDNTLVFINSMQFLDALVKNLTNNDFK